MIWLKMNGYYSLNKNGCNLRVEIVVTMINFGNSQVIHIILEKIYFL
jgi:hypothetical protein